MPVIYRTPRNQKAAQHAQTSPHVPMGDQRFQQLISELGAAFAQAEAGAEEHTVAQQREHRRKQWLADREVTIQEIIRLMQQHDLSYDDLA